jgi:hypothetical protein
MATREFTVKTEEDAYNLSASVRLIGEDVLVAIWGGEKPHIGAVAVAQPRPSLLPKFWRRCWKRRSLSRPESTGTTLPLKPSSISSGTVKFWWR